MYIKYWVITNLSKCVPVESRAISACDLIVYFLSNVMDKNSSRLDFAVQGAVCRVCSFPQLSLGSLAIYFPHGATVAVMTMPGCRTLPSPSSQLAQPYLGMG